MNARDQLLALQWAQLKHDEAYHKDVVILPLAQRVKHMALHNAKYTAYQRGPEGDRLLQFEEYQSTVKFGVRANF